MGTAGILLGFFHVLCVLWVTKPVVESVQLWAPEEVTGGYGGTVKVLCHYDPTYSGYSKYWCKGKIYEFCTIVVKTPRNRPSKRHFIADNKEEGFFTVTMTYLNDSDEDMYWCVISQRGRNIYTGVRLFISPTTTTQLGQPTVTTSGSTTFPSASPMTSNRISWWLIIRSTLFIVMFCGFLSTLVVAWRIKTKGKI